MRLNRAQRRLLWEGAFVLVALAIFFVVEPREHVSRGIGKFWEKFFLVTVILSVYCLPALVRKFTAWTKWRTREAGVLLLDAVSAVLLVLYPFWWRHVALERGLLCASIAPITATFMVRLLHDEAAAGRSGCPRQSVV